jgi:hypothetical protein
MDRLAELEAQAATLNIEIAKLRAAKPTPPPRPPRREEGVRVLLIDDEITAGMPSLKEMRRLFECVRPLAPHPLNNKYDEERPFRGFASAFRWVSNKGRTEQPNPRFASSFWLDQCRGWLKDRNSMTADLDGSSLVLAVYAAGDIVFCPANTQLGTVWELGLAEHVGRPADPAGWRRVLAGGAAAIRPPSAPARRPVELPSPVRIYGGV